MANLGSWIPPAKHHLAQCSLLSPACLCVFPDEKHNRWKERRKGRHDRGHRIIASRVFAEHGRDGHADVRPSDLDLHAAAARAASIRFKESHRPDPLLIDLYAGCLISTAVAAESESNPLSMASSHPFHYTVATKFIDDKLLGLVSGTNGVKQIVLLTDGFDTRPYRLKWPPGTTIFDISPESVFRVALRRLEAVGAEIMKTCKYVHIPLDSSDLLVALCNEGFDGGRSSLWALQGLPVMTLAQFSKILFVISNLAMKGCSFVGELPGWLVDTEIGSKTTAQNWMNKIFWSNGFRVKIIDCNKVARNIHRSSSLGVYNNIVFVAEQLQLSDKQCISPLGRPIFGCDIRDHLSMIPLKVIAWPIESFMKMLDVDARCST